MHDYPSAFLLSGSDFILEKKPQVIKLNEHLTKYIFSDGSQLFINSTTGKADAFPDASDRYYRGQVEMRDVPFTLEDFASELKKYFN